VEPYLENPQLANFESLKRNRDLFDGDVVPQIKYARVTVGEGDAGSATIGGGPYIEIVASNPAFRYTTAEGRQVPFGKSTLFTWTSKMSCPSFSLPAGPARTGGTCPAALAAAVEKEGTYAEFHPPLSEMPEDEIFICDTCYAGKGRYLMYKSMSLGQVAKLEWVKKTLRAGTFVRQMTEAIASLLNDPDVEELLASKLVSNRFFRIHDSGDFYAPEYYRAWTEVCRNLPKVMFWAPTRMWVYRAWREVFQNYPPPKNLALRPSALFTSAPPPQIPGMAAGTTSVEGKMKKPVKNCPAYEGDAEHSCAAARCRTCWAEKHKPVNYMTH